MGRLNFLFKTKAIFMKFQYLLLLLAIFATFQNVVKASGDEDEDIDPANLDDGSDDWDWSEEAQAAHSEKVKETYLSDDNRIWTEKDAFRPLMEYMGGFSYDHYLKHVKDHHGKKAEGKNTRNSSMNLFVTAHSIRLFVRDHFKDKESMTNEEFKGLFDDDAKAFHEWAEKVADEDLHALENYEPNENTLHVD